MISNRNAAPKPKNLRFLIINPFGIGDVLFTTPLIKALKEHYPQSLVAFWSNLRVEPVLSNSSHLDKVFSGNRGDLKKVFQASFFKGLLETLKLFRGIKRENFDICFDFSLDYRYSLFTKLIGIKKRIGFNYKGRGKFLTDRYDITGYNEKHLIEYYLDLLKFLKVQALDKSMYLGLSSQNKIKVGSMLASHGILDNDLVIGIAPGAGSSWGRDAVYKHWPALKFAQVADRLIDHFKAKVLILGDDSDREIAETISLAMANKPVNLTGKTNLELLPAVIKSCKLLITNDGGPMHIACSLGVKSVSVFGPVSEKNYGPFPVNAKNVVLKSDLACRPCYKNFRLPVCDRDRECLRQVTVDQVYNASLELLN